MTPAERSQLFDALSDLPPQDLERLLFELNVPRKNIPGPAATPGDRVKALLDWADSYVGCGLSEVQACLIRLGTIDGTSNFKILEKFQDYLDSVCEDYQNYWKHYAFIDEINESTWFEFSLDTQFISRKQEKNESQSGNDLQQSDKPQSNNDSQQNDKPPKTKRRPILQVIQELGNQSFLICGSSGSGKTTLLAKLFHEAALKARQGKSDLIPVLVELKSYETEGEYGGLEGLILSSLQSHDFDLDKDDLKQIRKGHLALFIDGFNELPDERAKPKIKQYCRNIPIVATSRNKGDWKELGQRLEIQPLTHKEVADFFHKYLPGNSRTDLETLGNRVKDFGDTPLMVWMLYSIFNTIKEIPETRGEAYRRFTTLYLERSKEGINLSESKTLLGKLAFEMMQSTSKESLIDFQPEISETDARNFLGSEATLRLLRNCHLLKSNGKPGNRRIKFCHQSLQEYYAAEEILTRLRNNDANFSDNKRFQYFFLNRLKWTETISLMMSLLDNQDHDLMLRITRLALDADLLLGAKLAGSVKPDLQRKTINLLLEPKIKFRIFNFPIRLSPPEWLKILAWQETKSAVLREEWLNLLNSDSPWERRHAIHGLRCCKPKEVANAFSKALDDEDDNIRLVAVKGLAEVNSDVVLDSLIKATMDSNWSVQEEAIQALIELRTEKTIPFFREMLDNESGIIRHYAVQGLSELGLEFAVPELTSLTNNRRLFPAVSAFLGKIGTEEAFLGLLKALENGEAAARKYAIEEIGKFNSELATSSLINVLNHDTDFSVRVKATRALGELGKEEVVPALIEAFDDSHHSVYLAAAVALMKFEPKISLLKLHQALLDENVGVRASAITTLREIDEEQRLLLLAKALSDKEPRIRCQAVCELGQFGSKALKYLQLGLEDDSEFVRQITAITLAENKIKTGISEILLMMENEEDKKQKLSTYRKGYDTCYMAAYSSLRNIGIAEIIHELRVFIEDGNIYENSQLIKRFLPEIMIEIMHIFVNEEGDLRNDARYLLEKISSEEILRGHLKALTHSDEKVRFNAKNALKTRDAFEVLSEAAKISIRQDNGMILRSLMEIFPDEFRASFIGLDGKVSLRKEYAEDLTRPIVCDFLGIRQSVSASVIQMLSKAAKKGDVDLLLRVIQICSTVIPEQSAPILLKLLKSKHSIISETAYEQLISLGPDNFLPELINMVEKENNFEIRNMAIRLLGFSKSKKAASAMPLLSNLLFSRSGSISLNALKAIQTNCQFYSYSIAQLNLKPANRQVLESSKQTININQVDTLYSHQINTLNSNQMGILNNVNNGDINIEGDQKGFN
jgi:HEAT repeat protein